jgi:hypothetical protein
LLADSRPRRGPVVRFQAPGSDTALYSFAARVVQTLGVLLAAAAVDRLDRCPELRVVHRAAPSPRGEQTAALFDWRFTRADLDRLLRRLDEYQQPANAA